MTKKVSTKQTIFFLLLVSLPSRVNEKPPSPTHTRTHTCTHIFKNEHTFKMRQGPLPLAAVEWGDSGHHQRTPEDSLSVSFSLCLSLSVSLSLSPFLIHNTHKLSLCVCVRLTPLSIHTILHLSLSHSHTHTHTHTHTEQKRAAFWRLLVDNRHAAKEQRDQKTSSSLPPFCGFYLKTNTKERERERERERQRERERVRVNVCVCARE